MQILHVASFQGNLGDRVNHLAFRSWFGGLVGREITWSDFEIRSVYRREVNFRFALIEASRGVDAIVIGGGGFWELWPEDYWSGTSLDLDADFLASLGKPVFFNALGVDDGRGVGRKAEQNFGGFLSYLAQQKQFLVSVRNDGSTRALADHFDITPGSIMESPDHGFFASEFLENQGPLISGRYIAVSLAQDMPNIRFRGGFNADGLVSEIIRSIEGLVSHSRISAALIPHIYSDLDVYSAVLRGLSDKTRRERVVVTPLETTGQSGMSAVQWYRNASIAWTMRFHASAVSIGSGVPTIGLLSYPKVRSIFEGSDSFSGEGIEVSVGGFAEQLIHRSRQYLEPGEGNVTPTGGEPVFLRTLEAKRASVADGVLNWLTSNALI